MNLPLRPQLCYALYLAGAIVLSACSEAPIATLQLQATRGLPAGTPVTIALPAAVECCDAMALKRTETGSLIPLQQRGDEQAVFLLEETLPAGHSRAYELRPLAGGAKEIAILETATGMDIGAQNEPLMSYNTATLSPPAGLPDYYRRSGFIHPFYSPSGRVLTDGFPAGHTHQHGIFFAWVNTTYRGDFTDFWNQQNETGTVAFRELMDSGDGPVFAHFTSRHEFLSLEHGPVLEETWRVDAFDLPQAHIVDLISRQQVIGPDTLFVNQYHYGGLGIRLSADWNAVDSVRYRGSMQVLTSEGITDRDSANHSRPRWTAVYGPLEGGEAGLALFDHPANFRFPQPVRVHPSMPYFVPTPMLEGAFELAPGREYTAQYRIISFDGPPDAALLDAMWEAYAAEITAQWDLRER